MIVVVGKTELGNYYYITDSIKENENQKTEDNKSILDSKSKQLYSTKNKDKLEDLKSINSRTKSYYSKSNYSSLNSSSSSNSSLNSDSSSISESSSKQKNLKRYESNDLFRIKYTFLLLNGLNSFSTNRACRFVSAPFFNARKTEIMLAAIE